MEASHTSSYVSRWRVAVWLIQLVHCVLRAPKPRLKVFECWNIVLLYPNNSLTSCDILWQWVYMTIRGHPFHFYTSQFLWVRTKALWKILQSKNTWIILVVEIFTSVLAIIAKPNLATKPAVRHPKQPIFGLYSIRQRHSLFRAISCLASSSQKI